jgi:hypothetical protein
MPCSSGYTAEDEIKDVRRELERATRAACDLARFVDDRAIIRPETRAWIREHEKADRERLKRERAEAHEAVIRQRALKKLTPEEIRLLGI